LHAGAGNFATVGGKYGTQKVEVNYSLPTLVAGQKKVFVYLYSFCMHPGKVAWNPRNF